MKYIILFILVIALISGTQAFRSKSNLASTVESRLGSGLGIESQTDQYYTCINCNDGAHYCNGMTYAAQRCFMNECCKF